MTHKLPTREAACVAKLIANIANKPWFIQWCVFIQYCMPNQYVLKRRAVEN